MFVYYNPKLRLAVQVCGEPGADGRCLRLYDHPRDFHMTQNGTQWAVTDTPDTTEGNDNDSSDR